MLSIRQTVTLRVLAAATFSAGATVASGQGAPPAAPPASVTYVANSGFLIHSGGKGILSDALFDGFPGGYLVPAAVREPLLAGRAPFDGIDLILATHDHADHFSAAAVRRALASNPRAVFVGPAAVAALAELSDRARALNVAEGRRESVAVNGIRVEAMRLSHWTPPPGAPARLSALQRRDIAPRTRSVSRSESCSI